MQSTVLGDLTIEAVERTPGELELHWTGMSNNRDPSASLKPYLELAIAEVLSRGLRLALHFEALRHFNSSTMAVLLLLAHEASKRGARVAFFYDASQRWQAHSFQGLQRLKRNAPGIEVVAVGGPPHAETIGDP